MFVVSCSAGATCAYMDYISLLSDADDSDGDVELQEALHASLRSKFIARLLSFYFVLCVDRKLSVYVYCYHYLCITYPYVSAASITFSTLSRLMLYVSIDERSTSPLNLLKNNVE